MTARPYADGSAGDVDYAPLASGYSAYRRPDPRIEAAISLALGNAVSVLNVGAGAGSYEPLDRTVTAVEPSASMRAQRPASKPAIDATAESLPFDDESFDAAMSTFSVHQWSDVERGLAEMRRVTRGPVAILSADPASVAYFWLTDYAPEVMATEASRYPAIERIARALGGEVEIVIVPIPFDCVDGFNQAYYGRPELLLDERARAANSAWSFVGPEVEARFARDLDADLGSGAWDEKYGYLRTQGEFDGALRLVISRPASPA
ncbi:MAG TPA: class I SAM-dependent methyltransferase [Galbitalea sp.]